MHHAGAVLGGDVIAQDDPERIRGAELLPVRQIGQQRLIAPAGQLRAGQRAHLGGVFQLRFVGGLPVPGQDVALAVFGQHHVADVRADRAGQVGRQRPRRGGPGQQPLPGFQLEPDGDRRVLPLAVDVVVHPQLVVGQRGLAPPAVGQHLEALVDQALVPELPEGPHDALHVGDVQRLVVVLEVDPAGLAGDVVLPVAGVTQHRLPAGLVELLDAHGQDVVLAGDAEQPFGLDLSGQAVRVPAESALHPVALHGPEPRHQVLDVAGEQVTVVGQPVGERRPVVEHEFVIRGALLDRGAEGVVFPPVGQRVGFQRGKVRLGGYFGAPGAWVDGHQFGPRGAVLGPAHEDDTPAPARAHRGTTSLAARACWLKQRPEWPLVSRL